MAATVGVGHIFVQTTQEGNAIHLVRAFSAIRDFSSFDFEVLSLRADGEMNQSRILIAEMSDADGIQI